jgi:uncharacterized protein YbjQ (UPF0145 family)
MELVIFIVLLLLGFIVGKSKERRHYRSIGIREEAFLDKPTITARVPSGENISHAALAIGSVVVSIDYFKRFLSSWRMIFGGELKSYSPLLDRGKREALLRMKESVPRADEYINCRMETSTISSGKGKAMGTVEVIAYSTAITYAKGSTHPDQATEDLHAESEEPPEENIRTEAPGTAGLDG